MTRPTQDTKSKSYELDTQEITTQSDHDKGEWLVPRTIRRFKSTDGDKANQRHSIEVIPPGYIERDDNTE